MQRAGDELFPMKKEVELVRRQSARLRDTVNVS
jgi:hypothetical protein